MYVNRKDLVRQISADKFLDAQICKKYKNLMCWLILVFIEKFYMYIPSEIKPFIVSGSTVFDDL